VKHFLLWLLHLVTDNFGWKLLSVGIATLIWVVVASEPELSTFANVPLEYKNLPGDLEISSTLLESIYLELHGPSGELRSLNDARHPAVVLDMSGIRPGERTFSIDSSNVRLPRGLRLVRSIPAQVRFDFEPRLYRLVPVRARFGGQAANQVASYTVNPRELRILGPDSHVARIAQVSTDAIDVAGVDDSAEFRVNAYLEDTYVRFQSSPTVTVTVTMKRK
jgi:hypothetical protein